MEATETPQEHKKELKIDVYIQKKLESTGKWAKFLSIVGFVFIGIFVLAMLVLIIAGNFAGLEGFSTPAIILVYLVLAGFYFFPVYYLFKFSYYLRRALESNDQKELYRSFSNLKTHYNIIGVITAAALAFYVVAVIIGVFAGVTAFV